MQPWCGVQKSLRFAVCFAQHCGKHQTQVIDCYLCCESSSFASCEIFFEHTWFASASFWGQLCEPDPNCCCHNWRHWCRTCCKHRCRAVGGLWGTQFWKGCASGLKETKNQVGYTTECDVLWWNRCTLDISRDMVGVYHPEWHVATSFWVLSSWFWGKPPQMDSILGYLWKTVSRVSIVWNGTCWSFPVRGYDEKRVQKHGQSDETLRVNYAGHSFITRFIISTIPKTAYDAQPELFHAAMEHTAKSCRQLFDRGIIDHSRGGEQFFVVVIGVKGDAPYLSKVGHLYRSFNTSTKRGEEREAPKGCCPLCLAGTSVCHAEEIATSTPAWLTTVAVKLPWVRVPAVINFLMHDRGDPASFFKLDIWHIFHLGFGRSWVASTVQLLLQQLPQSNLDEKWDALTEHYLTWCTRNHKQSHIARITPYLMSYHDSGGCMGNWHKGALTTNFMFWLVDILGEVSKDEAGLLIKIRTATYQVNAMFSVLFRSEVYLCESECKFVSQQGLDFLKCYYMLATHMYGQRKPYLWPLYPKLHSFHHLMLEIKHCGQSSHLAINPLLHSCQIDEDLVGRASRLSRRVSIKKVASRTMDRYLTAAYAALSKEWLLA